MRKKYCFWVLLIIMALGNGFAVKGANDDLLSLANKYVKIFINNSTEETGRFAIDVAGGDPNRDDDDNKPLIYGHPKPWTSFTTLRINKQIYVFGKATTTKRPGKKLPGGEIVDPPKINDNRIIMKCQYGPVMVEQILEITKSPTTGALDTARIKYIIQNTGAVPAQVGLRTAFDTLVGNNDGAPFRVGKQEITAETALERDDFPDFWQAFDSLDQPSVIAQGTLKGGDVTTPDRLIFTNWGKAADYPWDLPLEPGASFLRSGEDELDSAVVMFWTPREIPAGASRVVTIYYGLGGVTFAPGNTFLGISAPADVQYLGADTRNYTIVMYMEHRGEAKAKNVTINLDLPAGLALASGAAQLNLSELDTGVTKQFAWEIKPDGLYCGDSSFQIRVAGEGLESNRVIRKINIAGLVSLGATLSMPKLKVVDNQWEPNPMPIKLKLRNLDALMAYDLKAVMSAGSGLQIATGERKEKVLSDLDPAKEKTVSWMINPQPQTQVAKGAFKITVTGANTVPLEIPGEVALPDLPSKLSFSDPGPLKPGQIFYLDLNAYNLSEVREFSFDLQYDPARLRLVYISRGTFGVESDGQLCQWTGGKIDAELGKVTLISGKRSAPLNWTLTTLARFNFVALGSGNCEVKITKIKLKDAKGNLVSSQFIPFKNQIMEEKK
jgi:hypothetical protein